MNLARTEYRPDLGTIAAVIARSPIIVAQPPVPVRGLPAGFDQVDAAILDWIAAEGRRIGHSFTRM